MELLTSGLEILIANNDLSKAGLQFVFFIFIPHLEHDDDSNSEPEEVIRFRGEHLFIEDKFFFLIILQNLEMFIFNYLSSYFTF